MFDLSIFLPFTAALIHGTGFVLYSRQSKNGESVPNPVSWFLWAFLSTLNALSFKELNDAVAALQFFAGSVGCIATFIYVLFIGKLAWPKLNDVLMAVIGLYGIHLWKIVGIQRAYLVFVAVIIWSFIPTVINVWKDPRYERQTAWWFWTAAFSITSINTYVFNGGWTKSMLVPVGGIILHGIVPILVRDSRKVSWRKKFELHTA